MTPRCRTFGFLLLLAGLAFGANGSAPEATGARAAGRAGIDTAIADDAHAVSTNPAGLGFQRGASFTGTLQIRTGETSFQNKFNDGEVKETVGLAPAFGLVLPVAGTDASEPVIDALAAQGEYLCPDCHALVAASDTHCANCGAEFEPLPAPIPRIARARDPDRAVVRLGLGLDVWGGSGGESKVKTPDFPESFREKSSTSLVAFGPALAVRVTPRLSLGLGVYYLDARLRNEGGAASRDSTIKGQVRIHDPPNPPLPQPGLDWETLAGGTGAATIRVATRQVEGRGWGYRLGGIYKLNGRIALGLAYRSPSYLGALKGQARIDANRTVNTAFSNLAPFFQNIFLTLFPNRASQGFASEYRLRVHDFEHPQRLSAGVAWDVDRRLRLSGEYTWINWERSFDRFKVTLSRGTNPDVNEFVGGSTTVSRTYLEWRDQHVLAAAAEYRLLEPLVLRGGWSWAENPVPRRTVSATGAGIQEHHLAGGLGYELESWDLDASVVYALPKAITSAGISRSDANADDTRIHQYMLVFFLGVGYRF